MNLGYLIKKQGWCCLPGWVIQRTQQDIDGKWLQTGYEPVLVLFQTLSIAPLPSLLSLDPMVPLPLPPSLSPHLWSLQVPLVVWGLF